MRGVIVCNGLPPECVGGMQRHTMEFACALMNCGVEVSIYDAPPRTGYDVARVKGGLQDCEEERGRSRPPAYAHVPWNGRARVPGAYVRASLAQSRLALEMVRPQFGRIDFVYAQGLLGHAFSIQPEKDGVPRLICNPHGLQPFQDAQSWLSWVRTRWIRRAYRQIFRSRALIVSLGGRLTQILQREGVGDQRIVEQPNGTPSYFVGSPPPKRDWRLGARRLLFVGRSDYYKGLPILRAAFQSVRSSDHSLDIVGPRMRARPKPGENWHGEINVEGRVRELMDEADVLVMPSLAEGMPTVILEAMARGLPVIGTDTGATAAVVSDKNGWLIPPGDERAMERLLGEVLAARSEVLEDRSKAARRTAEDLRWSVIACEFLGRMRLAP